MQKISFVFQILYFTVDAGVIGGCQQPSKNGHNKINQLLNAMNQKNRSFRSMLKPGLTRPNFLNCVQITFFHDFGQKFSFKGGGTWWRGVHFRELFGNLLVTYGFQARNGDFARDILQKMVWREVVFLGAYGQISDPYAGFAIWEIKSPWVFVYFTSTTAIGVSVSAM